MGRKVHPIGYRLNVIKSWDGRWYADGEDYVDQLHQDIEIRKMIQNLKVKNPKSEKEELVPISGISKVEVERFPGKVKVVVNTAKPGILIGRKGDNVKEIRQSLESLTGKKVDLEIKEIKNPDLDAYLVGMNIAGQIERRVGYRRAMKRAIQQAMRQGAQGIKISVSGRLSGADMARIVWLREGRVPLQTLRADIDFARTEANTTYGKIGIKVWIYRGTVLSMNSNEEPAQSANNSGVYVSE